ncbi:MAG: helical backbone metal receptor [Spirochaetota bacterium]
MKKKFIINILSIILYLITGCGNKYDAETGSIADSSSVKNPARIISLSPAVTEELYLLDAGNLLVANTFYCNRPPDARKKKKIGNMNDFDVETALRLKPDLIFCTDLADKKKIRKLKQLGITIMEFLTPEKFTDICTDFLRIGKAINKTEKAEAIIYAVKADIASKKEKTQSLPKKKVFIQIGTKPLFTIDRHYFINDYIESGGGVSISKKAASGLFSRESVVAANPDVIIITAMGIASIEEKEIWKRYPTINAVKNNDIHIVDPDVFCNHTVSAFAESLKQIIAILHPEIKL